ncbi:MAG: response regulator [Gammaproteobacteria bacterium]
MPNAANPIVLLMADDDPDDRELAKEALIESRVTNELRFVEDGEQLMDFLHRRNGYENAPKPGLILLDLNMPRKDGREALKEIKSSEDLRRIPVVILTTSRAEEDMLSGYDLGATSYISKPVTFESLVALMKAIGHYWIEFVELPNGN